MSLRKQLLLVSVLMLVLPWAGYQYVRETEISTREAQQDALAAKTQAIALMLQQVPSLQKNTSHIIYAAKKTRPIALDGYLDLKEWEMAHFRQLPGQDSGAAVDISAKYALLADRENVYLAVTVIDNKIDYFNPVEEIVNGDRILLVFQQAATSAVLPPTAEDSAEATAKDEKFIYTFVTEAPGQVTARRLLGKRYNRLGEREHVLKGFWQDTRDGFQFEAKIPRAKFDKLALFVVSPAPAKAVEMVGTVPFSTDNLPSLLTIDFELDKLLSGLAQPGSRLRVVNQQGWLLSEYNRLASTDDVAPEMNVSGIATAILRRLVSWILSDSNAPPNPIENIGGQLESEIFATARPEKNQTFWYKSVESKDPVLVAVSPVVVDSHLLALVVAEQRSDTVTSVANSALTRLVYFTFIAMAVAGGGLLLFATVLSHRIRTLRNLIDSAIDENGQVCDQFPVSTSRDEIGDLSRSYAQLLKRLHDYAAYLRSLASKLSHELRTPLAVVTSSLENLHSENLHADANVYADRARQGALRLRKLIVAMSEATRIEQSIATADAKEFSLAGLLQECVSAYASVYVNRQIRLEVEAAAEGKKLYGMPELIVQMLDKLIDNAVDFSHEDSLIQVNLKSSENRLLLEVMNEGAPLPEAMRTQLFDAMVSVREVRDDRPHLGLGLHIVKLIAEVHDAQIQADNLHEGKGVVFRIFFPIYTA